MLLHDHLIGIICRSMSQDGCSSPSPLQLIGWRRIKGGHLGAIKAPHKRQHGWIRPVVADEGLFQESHALHSFLCHFFVHLGVFQRWLLLFISSCSYQSTKQPQWGGGGEGSLLRFSCNINVWSFMQSGDVVLILVGAPPIWTAGPLGTEGFN